MNAEPDGIEELLTVDEVAQLLKVKPATVRRLVERGQLPRPIRLNPRVLRWSAVEVRRWIERQERMSRGQPS